VHTTSHLKRNMSETHNYDERSKNSLHLHSSKISRIEDIADLVQKRLNRVSQ